MAVYSKERVVAKRFQIALCVSEKVAVTDPVGTSSIGICNSPTLRSKSCVPSFRAADRSGGWVRSPGPPRRPSPRQVRFIAPPLSWSFARAAYHYTGFSSDRRAGHQSPFWLERASAGRRGWFSSKRTSKQPRTALDRGALTAMLKNLLEEVSQFRALARPFLPILRYRAAFSWPH